MKKIDLGKQFASRLRDALLTAGLHSDRSISGVCIHSLSEMMGYSLQICRKYLKGETIPEPLKLIELATKLNVSPGWLLFGDLGQSPSSNTEDYLINKNILHYIFEQAQSLPQTLNPKPAANYLLELCKTLSQVNASKEDLIKMIDLAFSSLKYSPLYLEKAISI